MRAAKTSSPRTNTATNGTSATKPPRFWAIGDCVIPKRSASRSLRCLVAAMAFTIVIAIMLAPAAPPAIAAAQARRAASMVHLGAEPFAARRVVLYGDSLAAQSQQFFMANLARAGITHVTTEHTAGPQSATGWAKCAPTPRESTQMR